MRLACHPGQRVRVILSLKPMSGNDPWVASGNLKMAVKGQKGFRTVSGDCRRDGDALSCAGDRDTGAFRLVSSRQRNVLLTVTDRLLLQRNGCDDESYIEQKPDKENTRFFCNPLRHLSTNRFAITHLRKCLLISPPRKVFCRRSFA
jgi:hypothetical protein